MILVASSKLKQKLKIWQTRHLNLKHYHSIVPQDQKLHSLLKCCKQSSEISQIHGYMVKTGLDYVPFNLSKLLASLVFDIDYAASIFNRIQNPNLFMYNTMLRGYSISDDPKLALGVFNDLRGQGIVLDQFSFVASLKACARGMGIGIGEGIHGVGVKSGHCLFINVKNCLLHMYCVCGRIGDAHQVFDEIPERNDLVSWNTLMGGYLNVSQSRVVLDLFWQMCRHGVEIRVSNVLNVVSAAGELGNSLGQNVHGYCIKSGFSLDLNVVTALIDMYSKGGDMKAGNAIFDGVPEKDVVLWNCLIGGYAKNGFIKDSVTLLHRMKVERVKPNSSTLAGLLSTCAASGALNVGQFINDFVEEEGLVLDMILGTALVDMYAKCGRLEKAIDIFNRMERKDVKSWTAMISGYGAHGQVRDAIVLFYMMEKEGCKPNEVTFLAVLSACSHGGLVTEGMSCFKRMVHEYGYSPKVEHYGCMIDLLARAGLLEEAYRLIKSFPIKGDATTWRSLLAACRVYGDVALGECVKRELVETNDVHPTDSVLLSNTYAIAGRLPHHTRMQNMWKSKTSEGKMLKEVGCSIIEMDG